MPHRLRNLPMVKAWLHARTVMFLRKLRSTASANFRRPEHDGGEGIWWKANATHPWHSRDAVLPLSEASNGEGVAAPREDDIPAENGKYSSS